MSAQQIVANTHKASELSSRTLGAGVVFRPRRQLRRSRACQSSPAVASGLIEFLERLWRRPQTAVHFSSPLPVQVQSRPDIVIKAAAVAIGLRLTGVCVRLASIIAEQLAKDAAWLRHATSRLQHSTVQHGSLRLWGRRRQQQQRQQQTEFLQQQKLQRLEERQQSKQQQLAAQLLQAQSMLQQHRPDKELMRVIKSLGDSSIPLDKKWLEFTQRLTSHGHDAISDSMQQLFTAAGESSQAVQALLSPELQSQELWKSARTQSVIQQEQAFKQMVFNQLLLT